LNHLSIKLKIEIRIRQVKKSDFQTKITLNKSRLHVNREKYIRYGFDKKKSG